VKYLPQICLTWVFLPSNCNFIDDCATFLCLLILKWGPLNQKASAASYCTTVNILRGLDQVQQWFTICSFNLYSVYSMLSHLGLPWPPTSSGDCGPWSKPKYQLLSLGTWWVIVEKLSSLCVCVELLVIMNQRVYSIIHRVALR